jgi:arylsulfatase A-like enzyme
MLRALVVASLFGLVGCGGGSGSSSDAPNVLLITLDTFRADYLSASGSDRTRTPNLDGVAAEGAWFANALSASAVTPVSHASILTGRFPYHHGLRVLHAGSGFRLPKEEPTLATAFKAAGYRTGAVHSAFPVSGYFGFDRDFDVFDSFDGALEAKDDGTSTGWDVRKLQRRSDETTARALGFVEGGDGPWFLWIHYWDPHDGALVPPAEFMADVPRTAGGQIMVDDLYAAEVEYLDQEFGVLVKGLRTRGMWDDTLVAITADHGEGLSDGLARHGWAFHRLVYQEQLHVPMIVRGPGIPAGGQVAELVRTVDVAPTLLDYAGIEDPSRPDGVTLRPLLEGRADVSRVAYADQINGYDLNSKIAEKLPSGAFLNCVVDWPWKLIWRPHMPQAPELFNLEQDPEERTNLVAQHPERVARLLSDLIERRPWVTEPFPDLGAGADGVGGVLGALGYAEGEAGEGPEWSWTCLVHAKVRKPNRGPCPRCGKKMFPVAAE